MTMKPTIETLRAALYAMHRRATGDCARSTCPARHDSFAPSPVYMSSVDPTLDADLLLDSALNELESLRQVAVCHFCSEAMEPDEIDHHFDTCDKHPLRAARRDLAASVANEARLVENLYDEQRKNARLLETIEEMRARFSSAPSRGASGCGPSSGRPRPTR